MLDPEIITLIHSQIFENSPDMMLVLDDQYVVQKVNSAYAAFRGISEEQASGRPLADLVGREFFEQVVRQRVEGAFDGHAAQCQDWMEHPRLGPRYIDACHYPLIRGAGGRARWVAVVLRDLTREKEAADERERLAADLEARSAELALQRAQLEEVIRQMPAGILIAKPTGEIVTGNRRMEGIWRRPVLAARNTEEFLGEKGFHPDGRRYEPGEWPMARSLLHGEAVTGEEIEIERGDGTRAFISASSAPVRDEAGTIVAGVVVHMDISARKRMEEELRTANQTLRIHEEIIDQSPDLITVLDRAYTFRMVNPAYARFRGLPQDQLIGRRAGEAVGGEFFQTNVRPLFDRCFAGETARYEAWFPYAVPGHRYMEVSCFPLPDEKGVELVVAVLRDMTARKRAEDERDRLFEEVERRAAEINAAIDSMPEGAVMYGPEGEILRMNSAAERLMRSWRVDVDLPIAERKAMLQMETAEGKPLAVEEAPALRALRGETVRGVVSRWLDSDGRATWYSCSAAPIRTPEGVLLGAIAVFDDITVLHDLQEQREDFLRIVSHDLRSPLVAIGGFAERLRRQFEEAGLGEVERKYLAFIADGAKQMGAIIQDLVDSTRLESGQLQLEGQPLALGGFVADLLERAGEALDGERIRVEVPPDLPLVVADPHQLERILTNLLTNALKYSSPEQSVLLTARQTNSETTVSVIDHGPGIAAEDLSRLFDKFYRAEGTRKAEGLGLGLYITRMLVEAHGGRIWAESELEKGSAFRFTLSLASPA